MKKIWWIYPITKYDYVKKSGDWLGVNKRKRELKKDKFKIVCFYVIHACFPT